MRMKTRFLLALIFILLKGFLLKYLVVNNTFLKVKVFYHLQYIYRMKILAQASMAVTTRVRQTLTNIVRKIGGKPTQV